jgi:uncharacterized protein
MSETDLDVHVTDNPEAKRFEAHADGDLLGVVEYIPLPGKIIATHTEVGEQYEGRGVGSRLVAGMLEQLRADGRQVQPLCAYVASYLRRHDEYRDVIDGSTPH